MARFYADENFPYPAVLELRRLGHDVMTVQEAGKAGQKTKDEVILAQAGTDGRAVLTHDRKDFVRLPDHEPVHGGIVVCTADPDFEGLAARIHKAIDRKPQLAGRLIRVTRPGSRRD